MPSYARDALPHLAAFVGGCVAWALVLAIGVALFGPRDAAGGAIAPEHWTGLGVAALSAVQILGFAAWATVLARRLPGADLGLRAGDPRAAGWCFLGSLTVWTLPSWGAARLVEALEVDGGSLVWIGELLVQGAPTERAAMLLTVCVLAPLAEEWIFRGYLWGLLARSGGPLATGALTSLLFAAYHLDPIHVVTLLPTAVFLGLARHLGGGLAAPVLAHFGNNATSAIVVTWASTAAAEGLSLPVALAGALSTVVCCGLAWRAHGESQE